MRPHPFLSGHDRAKTCRRFVLLACAALILMSAAIAAEPKTAKPTDSLGYSQAFESELKKLGEITPQQFAARYPTANYHSKLGFDPTRAKFWDEFAQDKPKPSQTHWYDFRLNEAELAKFKENGFVVGERMGASSHVEMYGRIYKRDLPVFITSDSILHAWHRTYDAMLMELEESYLFASLDEILGAMAEKIPDVQKDYGDGILSESITDADYFLAVARSLLHRRNDYGHFKQDSRVDATLAAVQRQGLHVFILFGRERRMDFSQFKPRGHYESSLRLRQYFQAMMWCGRTDMRIAGGGNSPEQLSSPRELGSALVLHDLLTRANKHEQWRQFDRLINTFVGRTDSATFADIGALMKKAKIDKPGDLKDFAALEKLQDEIMGGKIGLQDIRGNVYSAFPNSSRPIELPRSFTVLGQKFVMDSWVTAKVVFDDVYWQNNRIQRRIPSCLDVAFAALGNNYVVPDLTERIRNGTKEYRDRFQGQQLNFQHNLAAVRSVIDGQSKSVWDQSIYNGWLSLLRELSRPTTDAKYPQAMRTQAWAAKTLNTQLASWTQLRHDTILYVKQSYTATAKCSYPAGYVEPLPEFWRQFEKLVSRSADLLEKTPFPDRDVKHEDGRASVKLLNLQKQQVKFLRDFAKKIEMLKGIAVKEIAQQELSKEEAKFLEDIVQTEHIRMGSGGRIGYKGWYVSLFYRGEIDAIEWDTIVANVHTDVPDPLGSGDPGCILHQGVGNIDLLLIAIDNSKHRTVYAGPLTSHYEFEMPGVARKSDREWRQDIRTGKLPPRPTWTERYLVPGKNPNVQRYYNND